MSRSFRTLGASLACLLASASCGGDGVTAVFDANQSAALQRAEQAWTVAGIHDYGFDIATSSAWFGDNLHVEVRADTVLSAVSTRSGMVTGYRATIPQLFAQVRTAIASGSDVKASYEASTGYPVTVQAPDPPGWADAAWGVAITHFTRR